MPSSEDLAVTASQVSFSGATINYTEATIELASATLSWVRAHPWVELHSLTLIGNAMVQIAAAGPGWSCRIFQDSGAKTERFKRGPHGRARPWLTTT